MKFHFEPDLDFQQTAIRSVVDLFCGQEICKSEFTVARPEGKLTDDMTVNYSDLGIGNRLRLLDDEILKNLNAIQLRNGLKPSESLDNTNFTVEMETGTGKTYVYLRTIFELNRSYGFTKFVIVVPSVAIKEGVYKSLSMMENHFRSLYANTPFDYFLYDSSKLGQVRNFATSANIQIMVVTVGAINKQEVNNLYKVTEKTGGEKPIDLIRATSPILIVDEPQSVDGGLQGSGKKALDAMCPTCTLRYSATHVDKHHMVYRLDAVDAYERGLVKQIEVASLEVEGGFNKPYLKLVSVSNKSGITAKVEVDLQKGKTVKRDIITVKSGDNLGVKTDRNIYNDLQIQDISCREGQEHITLLGQEHPLALGASMGGVDPDAIMRMMIKRTIEEHLKKELRFNERGIKVLSLFFIDSVQNYRIYNDNGEPQKGKLGLIFEEEFIKCCSNPMYKKRNCSPPHATFPAKAI